MKIFFFKLLIIVLIIMFTYIIFNNLFSSNLEGFDIGKITNQVDKIGKLADTIPDKINDLNKTVDGKFTKFEETVKKQTTDIVDEKIAPVYTDLENIMEKKITKFGETVKNQTTDIVTKKITSVFTQLGDIFNNGLVKPITGLFEGIGNIFIQIFKILGLVVNKIVSLPGCIITYVFVEIYNTISNIYKFIMPNFLQNIIYTVYRYTIKIIIDFFTRILGIDDSINRCYGFNISKEMSSINSQLDNINNSFKKDFGKLDFNKIKV